MTLKLDAAHDSRTNPRPAADVSDRQDPPDRQRIGFGGLRNGSKTAGGDGPIRPGGNCRKP
jgi:hypothetical protein